MRAPGNPSDGRRRTECSGVIRAEFDWSETPPAVAVVEAMAVATNRRLGSVDPLVDHLDPDALNTIIREGATRPDPSATVVTFGMAGHHVSVRGDGELVVAPFELTT